MSDGDVPMGLEEARDFMAKAGQFQAWLNEQGFGVPAEERTEPLADDQRSVLLNDLAYAAEYAGQLRDDSWDPPRHVHLMQTLETVARVLGETEGLEEDNPIRLAFEETHGQPADRRYFVEEVKRIVYPLVAFIRAQEAELVILRRTENLVQAMVPGSAILPTTVGYIPEPTSVEARPGRHRIIDSDVRVLCTCERPHDHDKHGEEIDHD